MALMVRRTQLAAKVEATKGTAETLAAGNAGILAESIEYQVNTEELVRDPLRATISKFPSVPGAQTATVTCRVEIKGSGTVATAPAFGTLLKGCGFAETLATDGVTYNLKSADADSDTLTLGVYRDGRIFKCSGARGTVTFEMTANQIAYANFTFTGVHESVTEGALLGGVSYESTVPVAFNNVTATFTPDGGSAWSDSVFSTFNLDLANTVTLRENANASNGLSYAIITERSPSGSIDFDDFVVSTEDPDDLFSYLETPTFGALSMTLGATAGNIITFSTGSASVQYTNIDTGDRDGVATLQCDIGLRKTADAGNDELVIAQT